MSAIYHDLDKTFGDSVKGPDRSPLVWIDGEPPSSDAGRPVLDHLTRSQSALELGPMAVITGMGV